MVSAGAAPAVVAAQLVDMWTVGNDQRPVSALARDALRWERRHRCRGDVVAGTGSPSRVISELRPRRHRYEGLELRDDPAHRGGSGLGLAGGRFAYDAASGDDWQRAHNTVASIPRAGWGRSCRACPPRLSNHVLYLRPFGVERRNTFLLPSSRAESTGQGLRRWVALDEFLVRGGDKRAWTSRCPWRSGGFLPPGGATRVYLSENTCGRRLASLAAGASQIIMQPGRTPAMRWSFGIATCKLQAKLFILTAPSIASPCSVG